MYTCTLKVINMEVLPYLRRYFRKYFRTFEGVDIVDITCCMCTTGVGLHGSVDRAEDTVGVVLCF